jgi:hypothetical protein
VIGITNSRDLGHRFSWSAGTESSGTLAIATVVFPSAESVGAGTMPFGKLRQDMGALNGK